MYDNRKKQPVSMAGLLAEDRPQPHNLEIEKAVIGAMIKEPGCIAPTISAGVESGTFYSHSHVEIFNVIEAMRKNNQAIDMLSLCDALRLKGILDDVGGDNYIADLYSGIATTANINEWVKLLLDYYARRRMIISCSETIYRCYTDDANASDLYSDLRTEISENEKYAVGCIEKSTKEKIQDYFKMMDEIATGERGKIIVPWGIPGMDSVFKVQRKEMMVLAAGSGTGKTRFILNNAIGRANQDMATAIFSHENSSNTLFSGLISILAEVPVDLMKTGKLSSVLMKRIQDAAAWINSKRHLLYIYGKGEYVHSPRGIASKVCNIQDRTGGMLSEVDVDYIQNMKCDDKRIDSRVQQLDNIILETSNISGDFDVFLLALAQLNRDKARDKAKNRPQLADIKGCSTIEQESDYVIFLHNQHHGDPQYVGDIQLDFYSNKFRGSNPIDVKLNFCTTTGKINGVASRYTDDDNPQPKPPNEPQKEIRKPYKEG